MLVDIMMPVMEGDATLRAIRALPERRAHPIVALTANVTAGERERCIAAGASAYLPKPVEIAADLIGVLEDCVPAATPARRTHGALR